MCVQGEIMEVLLDIVGGIVAWWKYGCIGDSVFLSLFLAVSFLLFPVYECLGHHSCMSSSFPIALVRGRSLVRDFISNGHAKVHSVCS